MCSSTIFLHIKQNQQILNLVRCLTLIIYHTQYLISLDILYKNVLYNVGIPAIWHLTPQKLCYKVYNPKDHQLRPWILNCILCSATFLSPTTRSDKESLSDLNMFYLFLCIGLPYILQLIIRASLIKNTPRNYVTLFCK
jgi:hypothetical protein